jgi:Protein of unknown function (DUF3788)
VIKVKNVSRPIGALAANAFAGQTAKPDARALEKALGPSFSVWQRLVANLKRDLKVDTAEWHTGSVKHGWSLRLQLKKRNIVYLSPREGWFMAAFALGERAIAAALASDLPAYVLENIAGSKRYAEGTAVRIEVRTAEDVDIVKKLAKIKIEN